MKGNGQGTSQRLSAVSGDFSVLSRAVRWSGLLLENFPVCGHRIIGVRVDTEISCPIRPVCTGLLLQG